MQADLFRDIIGFEWDEANIAHIANHNVVLREAEEIFADRNNALKDDLEHSTKSELRFIIIGKTQKGRLLYQIFTKRGNLIRVISSRDINKKEVTLYEEKTRSTKI